MDWFLVLFWQLKRTAKVGWEAKRSSVNLLPHFAKKPCFLSHHSTSLKSGGKYSRQKKFLSKRRIKEPFICHKAFALRRKGIRRLRFPTEKTKENSLSGAVPLKKLLGLIPESFRCSFYRKKDNKPKKIAFGLEIIPQNSKYNFQKATLNSPPPSP